MEESMAKSPRVEPQNAEQINEELRRVIKNLQDQIAAKDKRIQELEGEVKQKNLELPPVTEGKTTKFIELPNECLLEIMSYLSTYDILKRFAPVSKKFHKLSQDQHLIRKIEINSGNQSWPEKQKEEYFDDFLGVLKRSLNLTFLSFNFGRCFRSFGKKFLEALPSMNHDALNTFCLKGEDGFDFLNPSEEKILNYLKKCPDLKVVKFEFTPTTVEDEYVINTDISEMKEFISKFKLQNLQEFHLIGLDYPTFLLINLKKLLETIAENLPSLQRLCLSLNLDVADEDEDLDDLFVYSSIFDVFREIASEKNIKIEIRGLPVHCDFDGGAKSICCGQSKIHPSKFVKNFGPS